MIYMMFLIGIILIILSIYFLSIFNKKEVNRYNEIKVLHSEIKEYTQIIEDVMVDLEYVINDIFKNDNKNNNIYNNELNKKEVESKHFNEQKYDENVIKLYKDGYSINDIAKSLNKGIREVGIIIKLYNIKQKK